MHCVHYVHDGISTVGFSRHSRSFIIHDNMITTAHAEQRTDSRAESYPCAEMRLSAEPIQVLEPTCR